MLTHPLLSGNAVLQDVSAGRRVLRKGESGAHIGVVQIALTRLEFPPFDIPGSYSSGTQTAAANFIDYYIFYFAYGDDTGATMDSWFIDTLDKALNGQLRWQPKQQDVVPGERLQAAAQCLPATRLWVDRAVAVCALAENLVKGTQTLNMANAEQTNLLAAFYLHFRLSLIKDSFLIPAFLPYNIQLALIKVARREQIAHIAGTFKKMQTKLTQTADNIYVEAGPHPTVPNAIASCDVGFRRINLHPPFAGRSSDSISWITVHELVHMFIRSPHDDAHPYAVNPAYLTLTAVQCQNNPDCYAHFAAQMVKGRPQLTPWKA
jgi:hypothetical protein